MSQGGSRTTEGTYTVQRRALTTRAFTLIELLVVISIVALLIAIGFVAFSGALRTAGAAADGGAIRSVRLAIETFEQDHGFGIPLVYDGDPLTVDGPAVLRQAGITPSSDGIPVYENQNINPAIKFVGVYSVGKERDFFRGGEDASGRKVLSVATFSEGLSDARYSKFSLSVYLAGMMPSEIDGRDGPNMSEPDSDGSFKGTSRRGTAKTYESYLPVGENESFSSRVLYGDTTLAQSEIREVAEHGGSTPAGDLRYSIGLIDRYGAPYRYYRWEPGRSSAGVSQFNGTEGEVSAAADLNIPVVLQDIERFTEQVNGDENADGVSGNSRLRAARWAVVSAGRDGLFGTEDPVDLGLPGGASQGAVLAARAEAMKDNVVEVGP